jgi:aldehyde:ferredoxin oxidoreductase
MKRGSENAITTAIERIAKQNGFGEVFRDGVTAAAVRIGNGAEECAMTSKNTELEQYEFRAFKSMALSAALNAGSVAEGISIDYAVLGDQETIEEWARDYYDSPDIAVPTSYVGKAMMVWDGENRGAAADSVGWCKWLSWCVTPSLDLAARLFSLATGRDCHEDTLLTVGQRIKTIERLFNARRGATRADDTLPKRLFETAVPDGGFKGERLPIDRFQGLLDEYYALRGWDQTGIPREDTCSDLELSSEYARYAQEAAMRDPMGQGGANDQGSGD